MASTAALNLMKRSTTTTCTNLLLRISSTTTTMAKPNCYVPSRGFCNKVESDSERMIRICREISKAILGDKYRDRPYIDRDDDIGHFYFYFSESHLRKHRTDKDLYDYFVKFLVPAVGGEEEANERIYFCQTHPYNKGFCAKIDGDTAEKLRVVKGVQTVLPDFDYDVRDNWAAPK